MGHPVNDTALDTLFREARTYTKWQPKPVTDQTVRDLYDLLKWAPTSANAAPARFAFLRLIRIFSAECPPAYGDCFSVHSLNAPDRAGLSADVRRLL